MYFCRIIHSEIATYGKGTGIKLQFEQDGKVHKLVVFDSDSLYNTVLGFKPDSFANITWSKSKEGYPVLTAIEAVKDDTLQAITEIKQKQDFIPAKSFNIDGNAKQRDSIERQVSLKSAVDLITCCGIKYKTKDEAYVDVLKCAEGFYDYLTKRIQVCEESSTKE